MVAGHANDWAELQLPGKAHAADCSGSLDLKPGYKATNDSEPAGSHPNRLAMGLPGGTRRYVPSDQLWGTVVARKQSAVEHPPLLHMRHGLKPLEKARFRRLWLHQSSELVANPRGQFGHNGTTAHR